MDNFMKDNRFAHISKDPKFHRISKYERKIKIDKRFQSMFTDKHFNVEYAVDKRGRPMQKSSKENFRKYYELPSSDDENETANETALVEPNKKGTNKIKKLIKTKKSSKLKEDIKSSGSSADSDDDNGDIENIEKDDLNIDQRSKSDRLDEKRVSDKVRQRLKNMSVDYARGEQALLSDSSSEEESSSDEEEEIEHAWGEMDKDAERTDEVTHRLAVCHMDWDRIRAIDLMVLFNSFLPSNGVIKSVTIYPSEFGLKRMEEEEVRGPTELVTNSKIDEALNKLNEDSNCEKEEEANSPNQARNFTAPNDSPGVSGENKSVESDSEDSSDESDNGSDVHLSDDNSNAKQETSNNHEDSEDNDDDDDDDEEGKGYHMERLRQYQINRLKYYYAVVVFDSAETANKIYTECDGLEYETSSARIDLRFIPDDVTFDQEPKETCTSIPVKGKYTPRYFTTTALQQAKVTLTWDETDPHRSEVVQKVAETVQKGGDISDDEIHDVLATSSDEDDEGIESAASDDERVSIACSSKAESISRYRSLLKLIEEEEQKKKNDVGMEVSWGVGLKEKTKEIVDKKNKTKLTPFQQMIEKKREKKKLKKEEKFGNKDDLIGESQSGDEILFSDDELPSDVNLNDPFFRSLSPDQKKSKKKKDVKVTEKDDSEDNKNDVELDLLLMEEEKNDNKHHFNLKKILQNESKKKKKSKLKYKKGIVPTEKEEDDFKADVHDERFNALYTSHHFNIDPSNPMFKKTKAMEAIISEKQKRRKNDPSQEFEVPGECKKMKMEDDSVSNNTELSMLVKKIKKKSGGMPVTSSK